ncbi:MAG: pre-peptidase C-terminal domain-containing protein [Candidatus Poseidoniaceae archaeon]
MGPFIPTTVNMRTYSKSILLVALFLASLSVPALSGNAVGQSPSDIEVLYTATNPTNNKTYHLLSEGSWSDSAQVARGLDGFLATVDDAQENQWIFETFANYDGQSRHLWIGLSDSNQEGEYRWHDGTPFHYRDWGQDQPSANDAENYVHIAGTNMGNIMPGTWNDLDDDPQYFPVYGVVEVGSAVDYALRFDGDNDHIIIDEEIPEFSGNISITARINSPDTSGIQFITMMGDYGWGLYINNGMISYSSEYSISRHPTSNMSITENVWTEVTVQIEQGVGGQFYIDGVPAGNITSNEANIPRGDFGSNDCYQSGEDCDELFIGRMGAGCDCNYFTGMIDDVTISNDEYSLNWGFLEGEGAVTYDDTSQYQGDINGASWVMPDGTIVAQAVQLFPDQELFDITGQPGDQLLFFIEIEEYTRGLYIDAYIEYYDWNDWGSNNFDAYFAHDYIPNSWEFDDIREDNYDYMWMDYSWPEEGILWMVIVPKTEIDAMTIYTGVDIADPPPSLDEMTELVNEIPVTGQKIDAGRGAPDEDRVLYYYVNVTENLSSLTVKTYGGTGNINLAIQSNTVPDPFNSFWGWEEPWFEDFDDFGVIGDFMDIGAQSDWSSGPGNDHQVSLYNVKSGIYYITAYTYGKANDFTIAASMSFEPENIEPEDAIELTPGIAYGPLSGYDGLDQYFKINVPADTERLEVDLEPGFGEASLYLKLANSPTESDFTYRSNSPGAGDKIGFNDPTPGMWYILLDTEMVFGDVKITASFADRYVWDYDGTPIELFNGEEITGIEAPTGESLSFFVELEKPGEYLMIQTYGGNGDLIMTGVGNVMFLDFDDIFGFFEDDFFIEESGRQRPGGNFDFEETTVTSYGMGTEQTIYVDLPANGRFDITVEAIDGFSDVTIVANWVYSDFIDPIEEPEEPVELVVEMNCREVAEKEMSSKDLDKNGVLSEEELKSVVINQKNVIFSTADSNKDGEIEFAELLQISCNCGNELENIFSQLSPDDQDLTIEKLSSQVYENQFNFFEIDGNSDLKISRSEIDILILLCETTFDAFDGDGDGVPDVDDAFPNDPDESKDTDGDGVGDNADLAPSVANDLIYSAGAILAIGLLAMLVLVSRNSRENRINDAWTTDKQYDLSERMLNLQDPPKPHQEPLPIVQQSFGYEEVPTNQNGLESDNSDNLFEQLLNQPESPPNQLLGMIDSNGMEVIEYPIGSGIKWHRIDAQQPWQRI